MRMRAVGHAARHSVLCCVAIIALQGEVQRCAGQVLVTGSSKDNTLYESTAGNLSNGAGVGMFVGATDNGSIRRALIAFDLSAIPSGAVVTEVALTLHMSRTVSGGEAVSLT